MRRANSAFTLAEMLLAMSVLVILVLFVARLVDSASKITTLGAKRMDADLSARPVLDRMATDFAQIVKRSDVSYFVKTGITANAMTGSSGSAVNDWIAFYITAPGYYPTSSSPASVVAYRINSDSDNTRACNRLERMGKGLTWNGVSDSVTPIVYLPLTLAQMWPSVASSSAYDSASADSITYEIFGSNIFRFEYYYLLTDGTLTSGAWADTSAVDGLRRVAAICVTIAVVDPRSRVLLSNQLSTLAGRLDDFPTNSVVGASTMKPGDLLTRWQLALDATNDLPREAIAGVRLYERYFRVSASP